MEHLCRVHTITPDMGTEDIQDFPQCISSVLFFCVYTLRPCNGGFILEDAVCGSVDARYNARVFALFTVADDSFDYNISNSMIFH